MSAPRLRLATVCLHHLSGCGEPACGVWRVFSQRLRERAQELAQFGAREGLDAVYHAASESVSGTIAGIFGVLSGAGFGTAAANTGFCALRLAVLCGFGALWCLGYTSYSR